MYSHVILGGTFDHFHQGHKDLLLFALQEGKKVTLGLTKRSMNLEKAYFEAIAPYRIREKEVRAFVKEQKRLQDLHLIPITDIYGTALRDKTIDAIIVTPHTITGANLINEKRIELGLSVLPIKICDLYHDQKEEVLCSTNIRAGLSDRTGYRYDLLLSKSRVISPDSKEVLHRPFGKIAHLYELRREKSPLVLVGDIVTDFCLKKNIPFSCAYIDGQSQRNPYTLSLPSGLSILDPGIANPAGIITTEAARHILTHALAGDQNLFYIQGEEDLLAVAAVLLLPLRTRVVYGYPYSPAGMRCITVSERIKKKFAKLVY